MAAPGELHDLVERFHDNRASYMAASYNETELRINFLNPLFRLLGWDVDNRGGTPEAYKDVVHEDRIKVGGGTKAPDYSFRVGGERKFFLEAKKPSVPLDLDTAPAFQLRRYAWTARLPLSILSDFKELAVYDCRYEPAKTDRPATARVRFLRYDAYPDEWDTIAGTFSREAVMGGSLEKYATEVRAQRGVQTVDKAFLREIEQWREMLARNLALRNPALSQRELNYAVQMTIDRIIFLRMAEDRGIEEYGRLMALGNGSDVYDRLRVLFREADERYNSGLFHFDQERDRSGLPDDLTPALRIDDEPLRAILRHLYYPDSPYEFGVLPVDVLGQVYEQFLGKVIRLTEGHRAVIEEKPEVRKAGGVYYTPKYIVDYIAEHTLGKLLEGKRPGPRGGASKLRIVDPACGSGSFLIGAYEYLLTWHRDRYVEDGPEKHRREVYQGSGGQWLLTTGEKKRILLNNIFGVDIDPQAVEVTKLSLLLKVLEGESAETLGKQLSLFRERALPDLGDNIKCGNSLIGPDFYASGQMSFPDEEEQYRINVFDWKGAFPEVFTGDSPGFDAVIGNPPYIRIQALKEWAPVEVEHYKRAYRAAGKGNYDIYVVFVEKGLQLLNKTGRLGFILPHKFFNAQYGQPLRSIISEGKHLSHVVHFGDEQVFAGATTYTTLMFLQRDESQEIRYINVKDLHPWRASGDASEGTVSAQLLTSANWNFVVGTSADLFQRLGAKMSTLEEVADIFVGLQTSADDVFIMDAIERSSDGLRLRSRALGDERPFEPGLLYPIVSGVDVKRYKPLPARQYVIFPYEVNETSVQLLSMTEIEHRYPRTAAYFQENKTRLEGREHGRLKGKNWHGYIYLKNMARQSKRKICVPRLVERLGAAYDQSGDRFLDNVDVGGVTYKAGFESHDLAFLIGLLNSSLLNWYFQFVSAPFRGGFRSANRQYLGQLPIRTIDFTDPADVARHDRMVALVERMLDLNRRLAEARTPQDRTVLQAQIGATDRQIDQLVYELYGLTEAEIAVVEGS